MFWIAVISFFAGAGLGGFLAAWLRRKKPEMGRIQVVLRAASAFPVLVAALIAIGSLYSVGTMPADGERGYSIAIFLLLLFGVPIAVLGLLGGLIASTAIDLGKRS